MPTIKNISTINPIKYGANDVFIPIIADDGNVVGAYDPHTQPKPATVKFSYDSQLYYFKFFLTELGLKAGDVTCRDLAIDIVASTYEDALNTLILHNIQMLRSSDCSTVTLVKVET